eukprot:gene11823-13047_t
MTQENIDPFWFKEGGLTLSAEKLNEFGAKHWKMFAKEQYFDYNGQFISVVWSLPIVINSLFIVIIWLIQTGQLLIKTKQRQIIHVQDSNKPQHEKSETSWDFADRNSSRESNVQSMTDCRLAFSLEDNDFDIASKEDLYKLTSVQQQLDLLIPLFGRKTARMVFHILKNIFYFVICFVSVSSNTILITILLRFEHLRTTSNIFILNLALCDVTTVLVSIPFAVAIEESPLSYPFGYAGCKLLMPTATAAINSAAFTLLLIAVERFYAIIYPMRARMQSCKTKCIVLFVLHGLSIASVVPYSFHQSYKQTNDTSTCMEEWPSNGEQGFTLFLFSIQYAIPLSLIVVLYSISWNAIRKQNRVIIKMQQLQQNGCNYSRSQSWDVNMRKNSSKSSCDATGEEPQFVKTSSSAYSFRSTLLEVLDEVDVKSTPTKTCDERVKEPDSAHPVKSGQLKSLNEHDQSGDGDCDRCDWERGVDSDVRGNEACSADPEISFSPEPRSGEEVQENDYCFDAKLKKANNSREYVQVEADPAKGENEAEDGSKLSKMKKFRLVWSFSPFKTQKSTNTVIDASESMDTEDERFLEGSKLRSNGGFEFNAGRRFSVQLKEKSANVKQKISNFLNLRRNISSLEDADDVNEDGNRALHSLSSRSSSPELVTSEPLKSTARCFGQRPCMNARCSSSLERSSCVLINAKQRQQRYSTPTTSSDRQFREAVAPIQQSKSSPIFSSSANAGAHVHADCRQLARPERDSTSSEPVTTGGSKFSLIGQKTRKRLAGLFRGGANGSGSENNDGKIALASLKRMKQTRRTLIMFTCVVTVFAICMLPNQITWIWVAFNNERLDHVITTIFYFLTYTNSVLNPWIYGAVNPSFRKAYKRLFFCGKKSNKRNLSRNANGSSHVWLSRRNSSCSWPRFENVEQKRGEFALNHSRSFQKAGN